MPDSYDDARVLRDRQRDIGALMDGRRDSRPRGAERILVQIFDGGSMPDQPDYYYAAHPVLLGGAPSEGAPLPSMWADTSTTLAVDVLRGVPSVGDILVAHSIGGRWVAERKGGTTQICLVVCDGTIPVAGATISLYDGEELIASCTTGTGGCCSFTQAGTYTVTVTIGGTAYDEGSKTLSGGTIIIAVSAGSSIICCGGYAIPKTLTLTDAAGSLSFVYYGSGFYPTWYGGHAVTLLSSTVTTPGGICVAATPSDGPVKVCYQMICYAGSNPTFSIQRSWSWVYEQGTLTPIWFQDPSGITPGQPCTTAPPASCGSPHTDTASGSANPTTTSPFTISFTMADAAGNYTSDPIAVGGGDTVAVSG